MGKLALSIQNKTIDLQVSILGQLLRELQPLPHPPPTEQQHSCLVTLLPTITVHSPPVTR